MSTVAPQTELSEIVASPRVPAASANELADRRTDIFASDLALAIPQADAAPAVHAAYMRTANSRDRGRNHAVAALFGQRSGMAQAFDRRLQFGD